MRGISSSFIEEPLHDQMARCRMFLRSLPFRQAAIRYFSDFHLMDGRLLPRLSISGQGNSVNRDVIFQFEEMLTESVE